MVEWVVQVLAYQGQNDGAPVTPVRQAWGGDVLIVRRVKHHLLQR